LEIATVVIMVLCAGALLWLLGKILKTSIKWGFKLLCHIGIGFVALFVFNFLGGFVGISLGLNWINAIVTGVLGLPGVILLLLLKYLI